MMGADAPMPPIMIIAAASKNLMVLSPSHPFGIRCPRGALPQRPSITGFKDRKMPCRVSKIADTVFSTSLRSDPLA